MVIGVHAPEFAFEKDPANVRRAVADLKIAYPVALDNDYAIWQAFNNQYWPAHYFIDATGQIRAHHFGEGNYDESEQIIRRLLTEAGNASLPPPGMGSRETPWVFRRRPMRRMISRRKPMWDIDAPTISPLPAASPRISRTLTRRRRH